MHTKGGKFDGFTKCWDQRRGACRWSRLGEDLSITDPTQLSDKAGEGVALP